MNNTYGIRPDGRIEILLTHKDPGRQQAVIIDAQDLEVVQNFKGHFYPFKHPRTGKLYARGYYYDPETKKAQQPLLHRLIAGPTRGQNTTPLDGNTLDCTRKNLRNLAIGQNIQDVVVQEATFSEGLVDVVKDGEVKVAAAADLATVEPEILPDILNNLKDAGLIEKGVSFHKVKRRWEVSAFHEGKRHRLGYWDPGDLQQANTAVLFFREQGPEAFNHKYKGGTA